ncbi:MAG: ABC transporter substrate-binding protein [Desulfobacterales bacterium]|jgi:branched-chain amino acid transport system substrate-binding protein
MKPAFNSLFCLVILSVIAANLAAPVTGSASEPLVIGVPHSEAYTYANMMKNSFEMALEMINTQGGIKGRPLKLVYANDQGKPKPGEKAIVELVEKNGAVMLVGAYQSSNTIFMARMADKLDRPLLVCTAADDRITQRKWKNVYRLNPPAQGYTNGLEDFFLNNIKPKSMAIVYENSPYGTSGAMRMMWFCRGNDIELRAIEPYHKERLKPDYFKRIVARLQENPPDVIYMVSYLKDGAMLVKNIRDAKLNSLLCGGAGGFTSPKFIAAAGASAEHLLTATLWTVCLQYPGTKEYYDQYTEKYGSSPDYHGAEAYSALLVAADALKRADSHSPASIRAALDKTDLMTPFGPVKFTSYDKFERQNNLPTQVLQIIDGEFECVWPQKLASANFTAPPEWRIKK